MKAIQSILFEVYEKGLSQDSCNLTEVESKLNEIANQRVIEELEEIKIRLSKKSFSEHCLEEVYNRIKELKQQI